MSTSLASLKKFELVQLADKLKLKYPAKLNKPALVTLIDLHLKGMKKPLDLIAFPELGEYYESTGDDDEEDDSDDDEETDKSEGLRTTDEESSNTSDGSSNGDWFSTLRFDGIKSPSPLFHFNFHEFLSDIQGNIADVNQNIQDTLSTIPAVDGIFFALELYFYIVRPFFHFDIKDSPYYVSTTLSRSQFVSLILFWGAASFALPALIGYYINFIRYDLPSVEIDPLIFHVAKTLIAILIGYYWKPNFMREATYVVKDTFGTAKLSEIFKHGLAFSQLQWTLNLQQWPLIFGVTGIILCLYVL
ncbi:HDL122Wp [Eremothecium sinecaudum]|uniref:HDL122Wp n=1 Tax=Eremothecium sinecaudum TaxID=45286 RepID=A0A0X8HSF4_9SACH|nr:HDL122Wp [Eremothecium sinecaudum]AMD20622.1 HDL122Wp [Eremothecium sinecaudum]